MIKIIHGMLSTGEQNLVVISDLCRLLCACWFFCVSSL